LNLDNSNYNPDISIPKSKFLIIFLPIVILIIVIALSMISFRVNEKIQNLVSQDNDNLNHISGMIGGQISNSIKHLQALYNDPVTIKGIDHDNKVTFNQFIYSLHSLAKRNPIYQQVRWIDENGNERIRISRENNELIIEDKKSLQNKSKRYYFTEANALNAGEIYVSKIDLNQDHGKLDYPIKPTMRVAVAIDDSRGNKRGIIILNLLMRDYFQIIDKIHGIKNGLDYVLINQDGLLLNEPQYLLNNPKYFQNETEIDFSLLNFKNSHPVIWEHVIKEPVGRLEKESGLWTWMSIFSVRNLMNHYPAISGYAASKFLIKCNFKLTLISRRSIQSILQIRQEERIPIIMLSIMIIVVYGLSLYFFLNSQVRNKFAELAATHADSQLKEANRIKELENRFKSLFEANIIAQLVVNTDGIIELANKAACDLFVYEKNKLEGSSIGLLIPVDHHEKHAQYFNKFMSNPVSRKMGKNEKFYATTKNGEKIPVEIGLNPYFDNNKKLVLVTIISQV